MKDEKVTNKKSTTNDKETVEEIVGQDPVNDEVVGIVVDCLALAVRKEASKDSELVEVISPASKVIIDSKKTEDKFYKVETEKGNSGFCMKSFIRIQ